jgi:hypothetical protein
MRKPLRPTLFEINAEGRVWSIVSLAIQRQEYVLTIRQVGILAGLSIGRVSSTLAWRLYRACQATARGASRELCLEHMDNVLTRRVS